MMCKENSETTLHLIIKCKYATSIWEDLLEAWNYKFDFPTLILDLFAGWMTRYPGSSPKNKTIRAAWSALPKFISWQVWLEINRRIFQSKEHDYRLDVISVKSQLAQLLAGKGDDLNLNQQDRDLGSSLKFKFQKLSCPPPSIREWKIRENKDDFQHWLSNQPLPSLFFYGSQKISLSLRIVLASK